MDNKPSLSQYFGEPEQPPPAAQFFDEISTVPANDMVQSIYLGDAKETTAASIFTQNMSVSFSQQPVTSVTTFSSVVPTVAATTPLVAATLPDPTTFFDNIGPEPQLGLVKHTVADTDAISQAIEGLNVKQTQQVDKDADRRRDAWILNEEAQKTLIKAQSSPKGSFFPDRDVLTVPGVMLEEELGDGLQEAAVKYLGVGAWGGRTGLRAEGAGRDEAGLRELLRTGHFRAAVDLSGRLLEAVSQGFDRLNRLTKHTPRTLQIWLTRFAVLTRIKMSEIVMKEAEAFGDFGKPDMYYQFYPESYGDRSGSMVPFALRVLVAEAPMYVGKPELAMDKLYGILDVIHKMMNNVREGKTEDGTSHLTSDKDKSESLRLWNARAVRVTHSVINCAIAMKDYRLAIKLLTSLSQSPETTIGQKRAINSALCRICLQAGHVKAAWKYFEIAKEARQHICPTPDVREYVDLGLLDVTQGKYQDGYSNFGKAADQEPSNIMVANNLCICLLYMGKLKDAIAILQKALNSDPDRGLNESLLINLCTLYELESSNPREKKLNLLRMLCKYKSDTLANVPLCLKLNV